VGKLRVIYGAVIRLRDGLEHILTSIRLVEGEAFFVVLVEAHVHVLLLREHIAPCEAVNALELGPHQVLSVELGG